VQKDIPDQAQVFDRVAPGWYGFRHNTIFLKELTDLACGWKKGRLLNLGCGHGADFLPFRQGFELYGIDFSAGMLRQASNYAAKNGFRANFTQADMRQLPYPDDFFDQAIAVASLHHLPGMTDQLKALAELKRVIKPGGEAFISVWNRCQRRFWFKPKEVLVPWRSGGAVVERYYYLFTYAEVQKLIRRSGFLLIRTFSESSFHGPVKHFSRNICLLIKKPN
jgi:tRNA (uracil-5-)-methyltransferase TRM9